MPVGNVRRVRKDAVRIVRYRRRGAEPAVGLVLDDELIELEVESLGALLRHRLDDLRGLLDDAVADGSRQRLEAVRLLAPIDARSEVWACGVTYRISRAARVEESEHAPDVYRRVYDAERPELFFKANAWRVSGDGEQIAVRADSTLDVPEPEVALVCNRYGEIVGFTICNDVSSRSIEGENPLYLPQAKSYLGSCALGPSIRPAWEIADPYALSIGLSIERRGGLVWHGTATTADLHRRFEELVGYLYRADVHPDGAVLSTGTCLVPEAPFSLEHGDVVTISVDGIGTLTNAVVRGLDAMVGSFGDGLGGGT